MKKLLALIVCGTMVLSMTACGGSKGTPAAQNDVSVQAEADTVEDAEAEETGAKEMCSDETFQFFAGSVRIVDRSSQIDC